MEEENKNSDKAVFSENPFSNEEKKVTDVENKVDDAEKKVVDIEKKVPDVEKKYRLFPVGVRVRNAVIVLAIAGMIAVIIGGIFFWWQSRKNAVSKNASQPTIADQIPKDASNVFVNDVSGISPAVENSQNVEAPEGVISKSEQYQIREISFGGSADILASETEGMQLQVSDVRSEVLASHEGLQPKLLISWKTNKLAQSDVVYDKTGISKKLSEGGFGYSHALALSNLDQGQRYTFVVSAQDRWGNKASSEKFGVLTGKKAVSVFELIGQQFSQMFGWAFKK